jgi:urea transport system ATP-binding protein
MLSVQQLEAGYGESVILRDVSLTVEPGQVVCLMGRNGVGKTTLVKSIMGLLKARKGVVTFRGKDMTKCAPGERAKGGIGYVPQGREIFSQLSVYENLRIGLEAFCAQRRRPFLYYGEGFHRMEGWTRGLERSCGYETFNDLIIFILCNNTSHIG